MTLAFSLKIVAWLALFPKWGRSRGEAAPERKPKVDRISVSSTLRPCENSCKWFSNSDTCSLATPNPYALEK